MGRTTALRRELKSRFHPYVKELGFKADLAHGPHTQDFRRRSGEWVDVFDIQWEKYGQPRFVINFGRCPAGGVIHLGQPVPADQLLSYMGSECGRLRPGTKKHEGSTRSWFCQDRPFLQRVLLRRPDRPPSQVVDELLRIFPELDAWFKQGEVGPHLHIRPGLGFSVPDS